MTISQAINFLLKGDLKGLHDNKPVGMTLSEIFIQCINCALFPEVEVIAEKCFGFTRFKGAVSYCGVGGSSPESEEDFRARIIVNAPTLNYMIFTDDEKTEKKCYHKYATYFGLNESFDYCIHCNERKV